MPITMKEDNGQVQLFITLPPFYTNLKTYKTLSFQSTNNSFNISGNPGNRGRRRPRSPCYCDTSIIALNSTKDTIWQLQATLYE
jgi:hypothetical protein